jgi:hypothetical protein
MNADAGGLSVQRRVWYPIPGNRSIYLVSEVRAGAHATNAILRTTNTVTGKPLDAVELEVTDVTVDDSSNDEDERCDMPLNGERRQANGNATEESDDGGDGGGHIADGSGAVTTIEDSRRRPISYCLTCPCRLFGC